jgi:hypothetical protein
MNKLIALLIAATLLSGCAIPDPNEMFPDEILSTDPDWITETGGFTVLIDDGNNSTYETVWIDTNISVGWIEILKFNYSVTHLSFEVINNTVKFSNYSFEVIGFISQGETSVTIPVVLTAGDNNTSVGHDDYANLSISAAMYWSDGYAPQMGNATLLFATFTFDVTITYSVTYRIWNGKQ